jgi:hypothetical protein
MHEKLLGTCFVCGGSGNVYYNRQKVVIDYIEWSVWSAPGGNGWIADDAFG